MVSAPKAPVPKPAAPFYFNTSEHLGRISRYRANNLSELFQAVEVCPEDCIFQHTFRTLQEHHFIRQGFSNDFAHWTLSACNEPGLAEQLAGVDVREFTTLQGIRCRMFDIIREFVRMHPDSGSRPAQEPFYFCASDIVVLPTPYTSDSLPAFVNGLKQVSIHSIHHHFIEARLRLKRMSNDFSTWLEQDVGLTEAADEVEQIDIYTNTMEDVRLKIARIVAQAIN